MLAFTPEGSGTAARRALEANGIRWRFSRPIKVQRLPGYHSGPVERLDALEAVLRAPKSGRFTVTDRGLSRGEPIAYLVMPRPSSPHPPRSPSLAAAAVPAGAHAFQIGMSDQKLGMWQDPRFERLGIRHVRLLVYYNLVLKGDFSRYDAWMRQAHARGDDVLLTINQHSSMSTRALPTLRQYRRVVRKLRARYPWVRTYAAWNEANHKKQPLFTRPRRAAQFYNVLREECRGCTIVAADVLDSSNMLPWLATFKRYAPQAARLGPAQLHGHEPLQAAAGDVDARAAASRPRAGLADGDGRDRPLRRPLPRRARAPSGAPPGRSGGRSPSRGSSPRVKRVYLYHWDADRRFQTWDSAFVRGERQGAAGARRAAAGAQPAAGGALRAAAEAVAALPGAQAAAVLARRRGGRCPARTRAGRSAT